MEIESLGKLLGGKHIPVDELLLEIPGTIERSERWLNFVFCVWQKIYRRTNDVLRKREEEYMLYLIVLDEIDDHENEPNKTQWNYRFKPNSPSAGL